MAADQSDDPTHAAPLPASTTPDSPSPATRKAYHAPGVRLLGAVHLMTRGNGVTANGDGGQMMMMTMSDRALKQDIVRIGEHPLGFGLYLFSYRPGVGGGSAGRHFGVMADEVEAVMPRAVTRRPDGYRMVDYAMLGIAPTTS
jgi:hypothetical protein